VHLADWSPVFLSLKVAVLAVLLVAVIGVPLARLMARVEFHGKDIVEAALTLPLVLPPSVVGYGLLMCIGKNSPLGQLLDSFWGYTYFYLVRGDYCLICGLFSLDVPKRQGSLSEC
jgi:ABC-type molybdate transport system permease subunit